MHHSDKQFVAQHFSRQASNYADQAWIQRKMLHQLWRWFDQFLDEHGLTHPHVVSATATDQPWSIIDVGCGPGEAYYQIKSRWKLFHYTGMDLSSEMVTLANQQLASEQAFNLHWIHADAETWNWQEHRWDLIHANAVFQWFNYPEETFQRMITSLRPGGFMVVSLFGKATFQELQDAIQTIRSSDAPPVGPRMFEIERWKNLLDKQCGSQVIWQIRKETHIEHYPSVESLLRHIQKMGATNAGQGFQWSPRQYRAMMDYYVRKYADSDARIPATYEWISFIIHNKNDQKSIEKELLSR